MFERIKELTSRALRKDTERRRAHELYVAIAEQARKPVFYDDWNVSDDPEGRYDLLSLHVILVLKRLKEHREETARFAQLLFDVMFRDVDDALREMGVGDMRVGKKVRGYAEAFFGRALAYERAMEEEGEPLESALARNVYGAEEHPSASRLADYVRRADASLAEQPVATIMAGKVRFPVSRAEHEEESRS
jgi:cytochrome b pre-mRNA-processing protein 3